MACPTATHMESIAIHVHEPQYGWCVKISTAQRDTILAFLDEHPKHREIQSGNLRFFIDDIFWKCIDSSIVEVMRALGSEQPILRRKTDLTRQIRNERIKFARYCLDNWPRPKDWLNSALLYVVFSGQVFFHGNRQMTSFITTHDCHSQAEWDFLMEKGRVYFTPGGGMDYKSSRSFTPAESRDSSYGQKNKRLSY
ncbi:hypothetical protein F4804DRAFT_339576 [Jackrogersella minutella]|nr:hypothetical protein F4804DRAFT_339576 [Jackrogersella minutella]